MPKETFHLTHQRWLFVLLVVVLFLFAACSSAPSESEGKKFLDNKAAEDKRYTVKSFTKTNGIEDERTYTMEYEAELECLGPSVTIIMSGTESSAVWAIECQNKGQVRKVRGNMVFEKTENGWRVRR